MNNAYTRFRRYAKPHYAALVIFAFIAGRFAAPAIAQQSISDLSGESLVTNFAAHLESFAPENPAKAEEQTIDELMRARFNEVRAQFGDKIMPQLVRMEANYVRTNGTTGEDVLYETSFHLESRYMSLNAAGAETNPKDPRGTYSQPVIYFVGSARTPLALPIVSNLSKSLQSDAASYTINIGILPLPIPEGSSLDSIHYYVVIERAIQSNRSDAEVKLERFSKEFTQSVDEPVRLRLENAPPKKGATILKLEDNTVLDFYEDFGRFFTEHIFLSSDRLKYSLGKPEFSSIKQQLSIPYSIGAASNVKIQLLSVVDPEHPLTIVDTIRRPASYLAELDVKKYADGPYRAALIASEFGTGRVLYADTVAFTKTSPFEMEGPTQLSSSEDTLVIGGKQFDWASQIRNMSFALEEAKVKTERLDRTLAQVNNDNRTLEDIVKATNRNSIAGLRIRAGMGSGPGEGTNAFIGVEASKPDLSFDVSFGVAYYATMPYLTYVKPPNFSQAFTSPKSLGFDLGWIPVEPFGGALAPLISVGYYGVWSQPVGAGQLSSATLLIPRLGLASDFGSEGTGFGGSLSVGEAVGLGVRASSQLDISGKLFWRF